MSQRKGSQVETRFDGVEVPMPAVWSRFGATVRVFVEGEGEQRRVVFSVPGQGECVEARLGYDGVRVALAHSGQRAGSSLLSRLELVFAVVEGVAAAGLDQVRRDARRLEALREADVSAMARRGQAQLKANGAVEKTLISEVFGSRKVHEHTLALVVEVFDALEYRPLVWQVSRVVKACRGGGAVARRAAEFAWEVRANRMAVARQALAELAVELDRGFLTSDHAATAAAVLEFARVWDGVLTRNGVVVADEALLAVAA